jgi:hypothetical protein
MEITQCEREFAAIEQVLHKSPRLKPEQLRALLRRPPATFERDLITWVAKYNFQIVGNIIDFSPGDLKGFLAEIHMYYKAEAKPTLLITVVKILLGFLFVFAFFAYLIMAVISYDRYNLIDPYHSSDIAYHLSNFMSFMFSSGIWGFVMGLAIFKILKNHKEKIGRKKAQVKFLQEFGGF